MRTARPAALLASCVAILALTLALYLAKAQLISMGIYNLIVFFVLIAGSAIMAGIPIAFAFGLSTLAYLQFATRFDSVIMVSRIEEGMSHLILLAVPLFVFLGLLFDATGMARTLVSFLASLIGHVRGGLQYVLVGAMYLVSGISGSKTADMAAIAPVLFPEMKQRNAKPGDLVALLSATAAQTETVPPSLVLITIGSVTGVSIADLFVGGLVPSLILAFILCAVIWYRYRNEDLRQVERASLRQVSTSLYVALPCLFLPVLIRVAIVEGVATATEVSTIAIGYSAMYGILAALFFGQKIDWRRIRSALIETAALSGAILLIIGCATAMAWALTQSGFSRDLAIFMKALPGGQLGFLLTSLVMFIILGSVLEGIPAIVLFAPLLFPIAKQLGIHEVHYAMVVVLAMGIGLFAPPFGVGYYSACAIGRVDPTAGIKPIGLYMLALVLGVLLIIILPWLSIGFLG